MPTEEALPETGNDIPKRPIPEELPVIPPADKPAGPQVAKIASAIRMAKATGESTAAQEEWLEEYEELHPKGGRRAISHRRTETATATATTQEQTTVQTTIVNAEAERERGMRIDRILEAVNADRAAMWAMVQGLFGQSLSVNTQLQGIITIFQRGMENGWNSVLQMQQNYLAAQVGKTQAQADLLLAKADHEIALLQASEAQEPEEEDAWAVAKTQFGEFIKANPNVVPVATANILGALMERLAKPPAQAPQPRPAGPAPAPQAAPPAQKAKVTDVKSTPAPPK